MKLQIPRGESVFIGAPAVPMDSRRIQSLRELVSRTRTVEEAHLPQCFIMGFTPKPAQVLVVMGHSLRKLRGELDGLEAEFSKVFAFPEYLDVWPLAMTDDMAQAVRDAHCQIFARTSR